jgi:hypothetical protein
VPVEEWKGALSWRVHIVLILRDIESIPLVLIRLHQLRMPRHPFYLLRSQELPKERARTHSSDMLEDQNKTLRTEPKKELTESNPLLLKKPYHPASDA